MRTLLSGPVSGKTPFVSNTLHKNRTAQKGFFVFVFVSCELQKGLYRHKTVCVTKPAEAPQSQLQCYFSCLRTSRFFFSFESFRKACPDSLHVRKSLLFLCKISLFRLQKCAKVRPMLRFGINSETPVPFSSTWPSGRTRSCYKIRSAPMFYVKSGTHPILQQDRVIARKWDWSENLHTNIRLLRTCRLSGQAFRKDSKKSTGSQAGKIALELGLKGFCRLCDTKTF